MVDEPPSMTRRILQAPAEVVVAIYVIVDAVVSPVFAPLARWLAGLRLVKRLEQAIAALPPYAILALLVVPFAIAELAKVYAVFLMGTGHVRPGMTIFIGAYVVSILVCERIFHAGKARLMTIPWFAALFTWVMAIKDAILAWVLTTRAWRFAVRAKRRIAHDARVWRELLLSGRRLVTERPEEPARRMGAAPRSLPPDRASEIARLRAVHGPALARARARRLASAAMAMETSAPDAASPGAGANDNLATTRLAEDRAATAGETAFAADAGRRRVSAARGA